MVLTIFKVLLHASLYKICSCFRNDSVYCPYLTAYYVHPYRLNEQDTAALSTFFTILFRFTSQTQKFIK